MNVFNQPRDLDKLFVKCWHQNMEKKNHLNIQVATQISVQMKEKTKPCFQFSIGEIVCESGFWIRFIGLICNQ